MSSVTSSGISFAQANAPVVPGTSVRTFPEIDCCHCGQYGHYGENYPDLDVAGSTLTQYGFMMAQSNASQIDPKWILLDSQSTISVFNNASMLTNICTSAHTLRALTNGGHQDSTLIGNFNNLGEVWYYPDSIANSLSLADVRKVCRVTLDTSVEPALCVRRLDGTVMKFVKHPSGLYEYDSVAC